MGFQGQLCGSNLPAIVPGHLPGRGGWRALAVLAPLVQPRRGERAQPGGHGTTGAPRGVDGGGQDARVGARRADTVTRPGPGPGLGRAPPLRQALDLHTAAAAAGIWEEPE